MLLNLCVLFGNYLLLFSVSVIGFYDQLRKESGFFFLCTSDGVSHTESVHAHIFNLRWCFLDTTELYLTSLWLFVVLKYKNERKREWTWAPTTRRRVKVLLTSCGEHTRNSTFSNIAGCKRWPRSNRTRAHGQRQYTCTPPHLFLFLSQVDIPIKTISCPIPKTDITDSYTKLAMIYFTHCCWCFESPTIYVHF